MTTAQFYDEMKQRFEEAGFDSPDVEAAYILAEIIPCPHTAWRLHAREELTPEALRRGTGFLARRLKNEPWQYCFGWTQFRNLTLKVGPGVLIPRSETELLVDHVLKHLKLASRVCELGIGSGAISLSIAEERPDTEVFGTEKFSDAFQWAERNRIESKLENVHFLQGDLYEPLPADLKFDAVVANLPYIPERERKALPPNVRDYEPETALFAESDGLFLIEKAIRESAAHLKYCGGLFFEIGEDQGERVRKMAESTGIFRSVEILRDQFDADRFLIALR